MAVRLVMFPRSPPPNSSYPQLTLQPELEPDVSLFPASVENQRVTRSRSSYEKPSKKLLTESPRNARLPSALKSYFRFCRCSPPRLVVMVFKRPVRSWNLLLDDTAPLSKLSSRIRPRASRASARQ